MYTGNKHKWTLREDALLRSGWAGNSASDLAGRIGVSKNAVVARAHRMGLKAKPSPILRADPVLTLVKSGDGYFNCGPERRAAGYEPLSAKNAISWGAISGNSVGTIL
jgi:GcrA cell cycle regulator